VKVYFYDDITIDMKTRRSLQQQTARTLKHMNP